MTPPLVKRADGSMGKTEIELSLHDRAAEITDCEIKRAALIKAWPHSD